MPTTDVERENASTVRRGFEAFGQADMATLAQIFHSDATWRAVPTGVVGGTRSGRDDIFSMFGTLGQESRGTFKVEPRTFAAAGDQVFVLCTATATRNERSLKSDQILLFTLADGQVRDVQFFMHDHPANVAFWS
jgi:hypothetical protein